MLLAPLGSVKILFVFLVLQTPAFTGGWGIFPHWFQWSWMVWGALWFNDTMYRRAMLMLDHTGN